jgi:hypothetical protein
MMLSFPTRWYYDVLRGLDIPVNRRRPGQPCEEAIALVGGKRDEEGRWPLENTHQGASRWRSRWLSVPVEHPPRAAAPPMGAFEPRVECIPRLQLNRLWTSSDYVNSRLGG